jgi:LPS-assembly lipoprotein
VGHNKQCFSFIRRRLWIAVALVFLFSAPGCGFHLRGSIQLPPELRAIYIQDAPVPTKFARVLRTTLESYGIQVLESPNEVNATVGVQGEQFNRRVLSVATSGKAQSFELSYNVGYSVTGTEGKTLVASRDIRLKRDLSFNATEVLAKSSEEAQINQDMVNDAVQQILRQLRTVLSEQTKG